MSEFTFEASESFEVGGWVKAPGWFHFGIDELTDQHQKTDGMPFDGLYLTATALESTDTTQLGKQASFQFPTPNMSHRDQGEFAKKKTSRLLYAIGLMGDADKGKQVAINLDSAAGRQFVCQVELNDKGYAKICYAEIYHVDDKVSLGVPRDADALAMLPASQRKIGNRKKAKGAIPPPPQPKTEPPVNFDDI